MEAHDILYIQCQMGCFYCRSSWIFLQKSKFLGGEENHFPHLHISRRDTTLKEERRIPASFFSSTSSSSFSSFFSSFSFSSSLSFFSSSFFSLSSYISYSSSFFSSFSSFLYFPCKVVPASTKPPPSERGCVRIGALFKRAPKGNALRIKAFERLKKLIYLKF
jgi:hypothetical protein